jgi:hypothetical protein
MFVGFHGEQTSGDPVSVLRVGVVFGTLPQVR